MQNDSYSQLNAAYKALKTTVADINDEQRRWTKTTRPDVHTTLDNLVRYGLTGWTVEHDTTTASRESLSLVMSDADSGLPSAAQSGTDEPDQKAGRLLFRQLSNGQIEVAMRYPRLAGSTFHRSEKQLKTVACSDLTTDAVHGLVTDFMGKVNESIQAGL